MAGWIKLPLGMEVDLGPSDFVLDANAAPPKKGHSPQFSAHVYYGEKAGCIMMQLGTEVGLDGPGTHGDRKGAQPPPNFWPMSIMARWLDASGYHLVRR